MPFITDCSCEEEYDYRCQQEWEEYQKYLYDLEKIENDIDNDILNNNK